MINEILNYEFSIGQVTLVGGVAFVLGAMIGMVLMACLAINEDDD